MRLLKAFFLLFLFASAKGQTGVANMVVDSFPRSALYETYGLTKLPPGYNFTGNKRYPLFIWGHGASEGADVTTPTSSKGNKSQLIQMANVQSPVQWIANGWNMTAVNPKTGLRDTFIVIAPQHFNTGSYGYNELRFIIPNIISRYRIDTTRIYWVGLSAGGGGILSGMGSRDSVFINRIAAAITMITAGTYAASGPAGSFTALQVEANLRRAAGYGPRVWTIAGENDSFLTTAIKMHDSLNWLLPTPRMKFTVWRGFGHVSNGPWLDTNRRPVTNYYGNTGTCNNGCAFGGVPVHANNNGSSVRGSGVTQDSLNILEWLLTNQRGIPTTPAPTALAGNDIVITLPTTTATLNGTGSDPGAGASFISTVWAKVLGPSAGTITSPNSLSSGVTGLVSGNYVFKLTVTNSIGISNTDMVRITVNNNTAYWFPTVTLTSASTQNISTSTATVSATNTVTGSTVKSIVWRKIKAPGQTAKKIVWLGSSTLAGSGASTGDSAMYPRIQAFGTANGLLTNNVNLGLSGTSIFQAMPSSYSPQAGQDAPLTDRNITFALANHANADAIALHYPSNDIDALTVPEVMFAYQTIYDSAVAAGKKCFIYTTQPREAFGTSGRLRLREVSDSLLIREINGRFAQGTVIGIHASTTDLSGELMLYNSGDNIHMNNSGHRVMAQNTIGGQMFSSFVNSASTIVSPNSLTTNITGLVNGTHQFIVAVTDDRDQTAYALTTIVVSTVANIPPVANAGGDQIIVLPITTATLNGSATDADGTITTYAWTKISGTGGTITSASSAVTTVTGLSAGSYVYRLTATDNSGATHTDDMTVTVNNAPVAPACSGVRHEAANIGYYFNAVDLQPGDTLDLNNYTYQYVFIEGKNGLPQCPIIIMNSGGVANIKGTSIATGDGSQLKIENCTYIKVVGSAPYGIQIQPYGTDTLRNGAFAFVITGLSKNIEVSNVSISHAGIGMEIKQDPTCDPSTHYQQWVMDSIYVHDVKIRHCWNQGIYAGNTSPDNPSYDVRLLVCSGDSIYPRPFRLGNVKIYNCDIDSTGRAGIQLSTASTGISEIYNNTVKHSGMSGDDGQGGAITLGAYTRVKVYGNTLVNTLTYGIASQGASGFENTQIYNNYIDSSGYLNHFKTATWNLDSGQFFKISTRQITNWSFAYGMYNILMTTRTNLDNETTGFTIFNNSLGRKNKPQNIGFIGGQFRTSGNVICNNVNLLGGAVTAAYEGVPVTWGECVRRLFKLKGK